MAADPLLRRTIWKTGAVFGATLLLAGNVGAQCGSSVVGEKATPAAIQGMGSTAAVRVWAAGQAATASIPDPCAGGGCIALDASELCEASGDCIAITGVEWLNGSCTTAGFLPQSVVLLAEGTSTDDGGRWAAVRVDHNVGDANTDLDAAQDRICGGCSSIVAPLIGDGQSLGVSVVDQTGIVIKFHLSWAPPPAGAEALSEAGSSMVVAYSLWYRRMPEGSLPTMDGGQGGWTRTPDLDSGQTGGYSTDTTAQIDLDLGTGSDEVWLAIGLVFDGSGDPDSDANSIASSVSSRPFRAYSPTWIFADNFETGDTTRWSDEMPL